MNTIREIEKINQQELERGIAGTPASWHAQYANSAWCYVGNLDHQLTEGDVVCIMSQFGEVEDIHLVREEDSGKSRGFGFVKYEDARSCILAVDNFVGTQVLGRSLRVDHVEKYRLPKKVQEQEENIQKQQGGVGHAYEGIELENKYNVNEGVDLFAPAPREKEPRGLERDDEKAKLRRKEERRQKREEKEDRRRKRDERREQKEEKKRRKRAHRYDDHDEEGKDEESGKELKRSHKHKKTNRRHDKDRTELSFSCLAVSVISLLTTFLGFSPLRVMAWNRSAMHFSHHIFFPTKPTRRTATASRKVGTACTQLSVSRKARNWQEVPIAIEDELGCSPTLSLLLNRPGKVYFDPLNLATDDNFAQYREAELKHGRVAMVSVVSSVWSPVAKGIEKAIQDGQIEQLWVSLFSSFVGNPENVDANPLRPKEVLTEIPLNTEQIISIPSLLELLQDWTVWDFGRMIVVCGIIETFVWVQVDPQDMPGDYQTGYWGVRDKGLHERSLVCELENGRLAMLVMLYYMALDLWKVSAQ